MLSHEVFNGTSVETKHGPRLLQLVRGDILASAEPLVAFSTHATPDKPLTGQVAQSLERQYSLSLSSCVTSRLVVPRGVFGTWEVHVPGSSRSWLMVRIPGAENVVESEPLDAYKKALWTLFSSVAALELRAGSAKHTSMAMTFLGGTRGYRIESVLIALLAAAASWLRTSQWMESIAVYVGNASNEDCDRWSETLNNVLGRIPLSLAGQSTLSGLRDELIVMLDRSESVREASLAPTIIPLRACLINEPLMVESIAANGRKLAEALVTEMLEARHMKFERTQFEENIKKLRNANVVAPWTSAYFDTLRILGNEGVHYRSPDKTWVPRTLSAADAVSVLAAIQRVVAIYDTWWVGRK